MIKLITKECWTGLPDAILFDLDNTLYPFDPAHMAGITAIRRKMMEAFSMSPDDFENAFNQARNTVKKKLAGTAASHSRLLYFQCMFECMGLGSQVLLALDYEQTYWRTFLSSVVLFEGVKAFLDDIRLLGIPTAIVTDLTAQIQFRKILYFGLDKYFDYIITSEEVGFDKPHPVPFIMAVEKISPKGKNYIWMIGDDSEADIRGAKEAINALTLQKLYYGASPGTGIMSPDACFKEFDELRVFLAKLRNC